MSDDTCGAPTATDTPCEHPACRPDGKCWMHTKHDPDTPGRPTKLSYERQEKIASAIEAGKSITSAARMVGVDRATVFNWIDRGEAEKTAGNDNEWTEFYDRITRAKGYGEDFYFNLALELAEENKDHRFIASLMKQRYGESWADTQTGVDAAQIAVYERAPDKADLERLLHGDDD